MARTITMRYDSARVLLHIWDEKSATVSSLHARVRQRGHATKLMRKVTAYADEHDLDLLLNVQQFGHPIGPGMEYLIDFYRRFGFEILDPKARIKTMFRASQKLHAP